MESTLEVGIHRLVPAYFRKYPHVNQPSVVSVDWLSRQYFPETQTVRLRRLYILNFIRRIYLIEESEITPDSFHTITQNLNLRELGMATEKISLRRLNDQRTYWKQELILENLKFPWMGHWIRQIYLSNVPKGYKTLMERLT